VRTSFDWKPTRRTLTRVAAGFAVVLVVVTGVFSYRSCLPGVIFEDGRALAATLEPSARDSLGVAPDSIFVLTLEEPVPLGAVKRALSIEPEVEFTVVEAEGGEGKVFEIRPEEPLEPNGIYRVQLALAGSDEPGYSWAYQVRGDLRVISTLPGHRSPGVPVRTGIELEFSHDGVNDPSDFFTIDPFVPGTWERHRRTWVFVPAVALDPGTIYTCTLEAGLGAEGTDQVLAGDYVFLFETEPAGSEAGGGFYFYVHDETGEFVPGQSPYFSVSYSDFGRGDAKGRVPAVSARVYCYADAAAFVSALSERDRVPWWAHEARESYEPSTVGLDRVLEAELEIQSLEWRNYLVLPEPLPEGFYLAFFRLEDVTRYVWFQVTDLSGYIIAAADETVLWFNSLASGVPVGAVDVRFASGTAEGAASGAGSLGVSGPDGLARFPTPAQLVDPAAGDGPGRETCPPVPEPRPPFYVVAAAPGGSQLVLNLSPGWGYWDLERRRVVDSYWSYLYTDRPLYLPDDEVEFWGVLEPVRPGGEEIGEVTVKLRTSYYDIWRGPFGTGGDSGAIVSQTARVGSGHTFHGSVSLPNLRPGYYWLEVMAGGVSLVSKSFEVATYTKPAYRVDLSADKRAVFAGEEVTFTLEAEFFEGTPASGLRFDYNRSRGAVWRGTLTTGPDGTATLVHRAPEGTDPSVLERRDTLYVNADLPEAGYIWANAGVRVFERDVAMQAAVTRDGSSARIEVALNEVTLDRINSGGSRDDADGGASGRNGAWGVDWNDYLGDAVTGREVTGRLYERRWVKEETGQYYDFIEKVVRKTYSYREERDLLEEFSFTTGADGRGYWSFVPDPDKTYVTCLESTDNSGRTITREVFIHGRTVSGPDSEWHWYHLEPADRVEAEYGVGETVDLVVKDRENAVADRPSSFLLYTARQGLDVVEVTGRAGWSFNFEEGFIPNTNAGGVYFDGRSYHRISDLTVRFDHAGRGLDVAVTTDRESYRPGDRVIIEVEVTDSTGSPVEAEVNLCMVDEALYHLRDQSVDFLDDLYGKHIGTYIFHTRGSHPKRAFTGEGAEGGGEGGGERRDFRDAALFESLTTGPDGKAVAEVVLPDNLTSWRITYHAYASGVRAGSGTVNVAVRLPFFVELSLNQTYLAGDEPRIPVRAYGTALEPGTTVSFSGKLMRVPSEGSGAGAGRAGAVAGAGSEGAAAGAEGEVVAEFEADGEAFVPAELDLGELSEGSYELWVTGRAEAGDGSELADTVVLPITVLETYLCLDRVDYYRVTPGLEVSGRPGELATLTFSDGERGKYLAMLWRLAGGGRRVDMKAASVVAGRLLAEHFGFEEAQLPAAPSASELAVFQRNDGIALLPYADPGLELTAKVAALEAAGLGVGFDRDGLRSYLGSIYDDPGETRERLIVALYGLASLGEPVLNQVQNLASEPDLTDKETLYLCLGLIELGDEETVRTLYAGLLRRRGDWVGPFLRLDVSDEPEEIIAATSLAAVIEARLGLPDRLALLDYLIDNAPWEELNLLEMALYLQAAVPDASSEAVSFTLGPDGTRVTLEPDETYTATVRGEDLAGLTFSDVEGNVGLSVRYRAPVDLSELEVRSGEVSLARSYYVDGRKTTTLRAGDLVKVVVDYHVEASTPEGPFQIVDFLPSGLKAVPRPYQIGVK